MRASGSTSAPALALRVEVLHADLRQVRQPLLMGHYRAATLTGAEGVMDKGLGGSLGSALRLGLYPSMHGEQRIFLNQRLPWGALGGPRPPAVIIMGLGDESELSAQRLEDAVRRATLEWSQHCQENPLCAVQAAGQPGPAPLALASMLIGTGGWRVDVAQSALALVRGVAAANLRLRAAGLAEVGELTLVELYGDRASMAHAALAELAAGPELLIQLAAQVQSGAGARARPVERGYRGTSYDIVHISSDPQDPQRLSYTLHTGRARSEVRAWSTQRRLVEHLVQRAQTEPQHDPVLAHALFNLLVPVDMRATLGSANSLLLSLDAASARLPWEMLRDPAREPNDTPYATRVKVVRTLRLADFREHPLDSRQLRSALVIGEPRTSSRFAPLPGARAEAAAVARALAVGCDVESAIGPAFDARAVLSRLHGQPWRIIHLAGHGHYEALENMALQDGLLRGGAIQGTALQDEASRHVAMQFEALAHMTPKQAAQRAAAAAAPGRVLARKPQAQAPGTGALGASTGMSAPDPNEADARQVAPSRSALSLGAQAAQVGQAYGGMVLDGGTYLGARELQGLETVPELVFVNCCHLARLDTGDQARSDGPGTAGGGVQNTGLLEPARFATTVAEQLLRIGVRCVVAAAWAVDDEAAACFATAFYRRLLDGKSFADAVLAARQAAWALKPHDNTWAAYQCYGDPAWTLVLDANKADLPGPARPLARRVALAQSSLAGAPPASASASAENQAHATAPIPPEAPVPPPVTVVATPTPEDLIVALAELQAHALELGLTTSGQVRLRTQLALYETRHASAWGAEGHMAQAWGRTWAALDEPQRALAWFERAAAAPDCGAALSLFTETALAQGALALQAALLCARRWQAGSAALAAGRGPGRGMKTIGKPDAGPALKAEVTTALQFACQAFAVAFEPLAPRPATMLSAQRPVAPLASSRLPSAQMRPAQLPPARTVSRQFPSPQFAPPQFAPPQCTPSGLLQALHTDLLLRCLQGRATQVPAVAQALLRAHRACWGLESTAGLGDADAISQWHWMFLRAWAMGRLQSPPDNLTGALGYLLERVPGTGPVCAARSQLELTALILERSTGNARTVGVRGEAGTTKPSRLQVQARAVRALLAQALA